jgi:hypothetical protein
MKKDVKLRQRWTKRAILGAAISLYLAASAAAQTAALAPPPANPRDISGVWFGIGNNDPKNGRYEPIEGGERPLSAKGLTILRQREAAAEAGKPFRQPADECLPHGVPAVLRLPTPLQVIQTPGQVTFIHEASRNVRLVYMDEQHPPNVPLTFLGHSVGRWEGDTLVVDTIGIRSNWLDVSGAPASDRMHVVERWKTLDGGRKLEVVFTIDDPEMYTRQWTARREYLWSPEERVMEYVCEEFDRVEPGTERGVFQ